MYSGVLRLDSGHCRVEVDQPAQILSTQIFKKIATRTVQKVTIIRRRMQRRLCDLHRIMIQLTQIPEGTPFYVAAWTDGLLVEAAIALPEMLRNRPAPGEDKILFVSDLSREDRRIVLTESPTSNHSAAHSLRAALAQVAAGIDPMDYQPPLSQLSIRYEPEIDSGDEAEHWLEDAEAAWLSDDSVHCTLYSNRRLSQQKL